MKSISIVYFLNDQLSPVTYEVQIECFMPGHCFPSDLTENNDSFIFYIINAFLLRHCRILKCFYCKTQVKSFRTSKFQTTVSICARPRRNVSGSPTTCRPRLASCSTSARLSTKAAANASVDKSPATNGQLQVSWVFVEIIGNKLKRFPKQD